MEFISFKKRLDGQIPTGVDSESAQDADAIKDSSAVTAITSRTVDRSESAEVESLETR